MCIYSWDCFVTWNLHFVCFFCSKCARCILSIEFHQLSDQDAFKLAFRAALDCIPSRLNGLAVSQRFIALSTLTYHQWSHPTLMALMKGEAIDEQTGINVYKLWFIAWLENGIRPLLLCYSKYCVILELCNPWPHVTSRHNVHNQLLSSCCYLFRVLNSGLLFYTKHVLTTP